MKQTKPNLLIVLMALAVFAAAEIRIAREPA